MCCMEMEDQQASGLLGKRVKPDAKSDACRCGMRRGRKQQRCAADGARQSLSLAVTHPLLPVFLSRTTEPCTHCAVDAERRLGAGERTHRDPTLYMYIRHGRGRHWPAVAIIARGVEGEKISEGRLSIAGRWTGESCLPPSSFGSREWHAPRMGVVAT